MSEIPTGAVWMKGYRGIVSSLNRQAHVMRIRVPVLRAGNRVVPRRNSSLAV